MFFSLPE